MILNKSFDLAVILSINEISSESNFTSNTLVLSFLWFVIPSLVPMITPATCGLSRMNLVAIFAILH